MKKMHGIVDPISLTFLLVLGIATAGSVVGSKTVEQEQLATDGQPQVEQLATTKDLKKS